MVGSLCGVVVADGLLTLFDLGCGGILLSRKPIGRVLKPDLRRMRVACNGWHAGGIRVSCMQERRLRKRNWIDYGN